MGKKDITLKDYLSDRRRYADLINGGVFRGRQIVCAEDLTEANAVQTKVHHGQMIERINDLIMKQGKDGKLFAVWVVANQEYIDYSMPVRVMLQEALEYDRQLKEIKRGNFKNNKLKAPEFLSGICRSDRLRPVITIVMYWGNGRWQGAESLQDIIDFGEDTELAEQMKALTPVYPLHILNLSEQQDNQYFKTELGVLFALCARRNDKTALKAYLSTHEECRKMDEETYRALTILMGSARLSSMVSRNNGDEEEKDMCCAIDELIEDGIAEGREKGRVEGIAEGITAMAAGMKKLQIAPQQICEIIMEQCGMSEEQARKYI